MSWARSRARLHVVFIQELVRNSSWKHDSLTTYCSSILDKVAQFHTGNCYNSRHYEFMPSARVRVITYMQILVGRTQSDAPSGSSGYSLFGRHCFRNLQADLAAFL